MKQMELTTRTEAQVLDFLQSLTERQRDILVDNCWRFAEAYKEGRLIFMKDPFRVREVCLPQHGDVYTLNFERLQEVLGFEFTYYGYSGVIADILTVAGHESFVPFSFCNLPTIN